MESSTSKQNDGSLYKQQYGSTVRVNTIQQYSSTWKQLDSSTTKQKNSSKYKQHYTV